VCAGDVDSDLTDAWSDGLHRLPVVRFKSLLRTPQLETSQPPSESRERPKVTPRVAEPDERFVRHRSRPSVYKFLYFMTNDSYPTL
jgi:hypothetical protein